MEELLLEGAGAAASAVETPPRKGRAKGTRLGLPCQGGLGGFQHMGRVADLPFPLLASKSIYKINWWHC